MLTFDPVTKKIVYDNPFAAGTPPIGSFSIPPYWGAGSAKRMRSQDFVPADKDLRYIEGDFNEVKQNENNDPFDELHKSGEIIFTGEMPLFIKKKSEPFEDYFQFPIEPLITVSYKNVISRRYVAKSARKGSIKERWSMDDFDITIAGILKNENGDDKFPEDKVKRLLDIVGSPNAIDVKNDLLLAHNITSIAVESVNFPHTKGYENQMFEIRGYSDSSYNLLIEK